MGISVVSPQHLHQLSSSKCEAGRRLSVGSASLSQPWCGDLFLQQVSVELVFFAPDAGSVRFGYLCQFYRIQFHDMDAQAYQFVPGTKIWGPLWCEKIRQEIVRIFQEVSTCSERQYIIVILRTYPCLCRQNI